MLDLGLGGPVLGLRDHVTIRLGDHALAFHKTLLSSHLWIFLGLRDHFFILVGGCRCVRTNCTVLHSAAKPQRQEKNSHRFVARCPATNFQRANYCWSWSSGKCAAQTHGTHLATLPLFGNLALVKAAIFWQRCHILATLRNRFNEW